MPQNFYEMLGVNSKSSFQDIRLAYRRKLGILVRRKHEAEKTGASLTVLQSEERNLREALEVLLDPVRRKKYNAFRNVSDSGLPNNAEDLREHVEKAMVDHTSLLAVHLLAALTNLPLQELSLLNIATSNQGFDDKTEPLGDAPQSLKSKTQQQLMRQEIASFDHKGKAPSLDKNPTQPPSANKTVDNPNKDESTELIPRTNSSTSTKSTPTATPKVDPPKVVAPKPIRIEDLVKRYGYTGKLLQVIRENKQISIEELSLSSNVKVRYIRLIELGQYNELPAKVYVTSYVKNIAKALDITDRHIISGVLLDIEQRR